MTNLFQVGDIVQVNFTTLTTHGGLQMVPNHNNDAFYTVECEILSIPSLTQDTFFADVFLLRRTLDNSLHTLNPKCTEFSGMSLISRASTSPDPVTHQARIEHEEDERFEQE